MSFQSTRPCGARQGVNLAHLRRVGVPIHAPVRGATLVDGAAGRSVRVPIHAPVRGATRGELESKQAFEFQSTRPCGARPYETLTGDLSNVFQSTRPCGARHTPTQGVVADALFQSTRPCGARRYPRQTYVADAVVPIHAPVRGATLSLHKPTGQDRGSNPRARAGRDPKNASAGSRRNKFQSTRPCGARRQGGGGHVLELDVPIHAPVRGATSCVGAWIAVGHRSNPRARAGRDLNQQAVNDNSTLVPIHAPVRGATPQKMEQNRSRYVPIHAPVRGATPPPDKSRPSALFQSTRPCGARPRLVLIAIGDQTFQSTRPCGARRYRG